MNIKRLVCFGLLGGVIFLLLSLFAGGARGSGSAQVEINAAIAAGDRVELAPGIYNIDGSILPDDNTVLTGAGYSTVIYSDSYDFEAIYLDGDSHVRLENLRLVLTNGTARGIYITGNSSDITLDNVWIGSTPGHTLQYGVWLDPRAGEVVDGFSLTNSTINDYNTEGVCLSSYGVNKNIIITGNQLYSEDLSGGESIDIGEENYNVVVSNNIIRATGKSGIEINNHALPIQTNGSAYVTITGNIMENIGEQGPTAGVAIYASGQGEPPHDIIIADNVFKNFGQGIIFRGQIDDPSWPKPYNLTAGPNAYTNSLRRVNIYEGLLGPGILVY